MLSISYLFEFKYDDLNFNNSTKYIAGATKKVIGAEKEPDLFSQIAKAGAKKAIEKVAEVK